MKLVSDEPKRFRFTLGEDKSGVGVKRKPVDQGVQTVLIEAEPEEEEPEASQETKRLRRIIADATRIKLRREERDLGEGLRI